MHWHMGKGLSMKRHTHAANYPNFADHLLTYKLLLMINGFHKAWHGISGTKSAHVAAHLSPIMIDAEGLF